MHSITTLSRYLLLCDSCCKALIPCGLREQIKRGEPQKVPSAHHCTDGWMAIARVGYEGELGNRGGN
jgi:hypothetical protein